MRSINTISTGSRGAASELRAGAHLIDQGYHVFRSESPGSPFDLVVYRDGICYRVEVKTLQVTTNAPSFAIPAHQNQWDLLVLVAPDRILIFDSSRSVPEIKEDVREAYGWPRRPPQQLRPCGTPAGVTRHRARREALCPPCRQAYEDQRKPAQEGTQPPQGDVQGSGVAQDDREALGAEKGTQGATDDAPRIVRDWMAHLGYTAEQIAGGEAGRDHSACDTIDGAWLCTDEDGRSPHPVHDEMDDVAALVMFVLEHPALAAAEARVRAEGRRQAVEAIRARVGDIAATEWAALIVEEEGHA